VGQRELESDEDGRRQRRELDRALPPRDEREHRRERNRKEGDDGLEEAEVRDAAGVVLTPAPDRER